MPHVAWPRHLVAPGRKRGQGEKGDRFIFCSNNKSVPFFRRRLLKGARNQALVKQCKDRDNYTCQACRFRLKVNGRYIIECHHKNPIGAGGERETALDDLVCLCPVCHRIAHTAKNPLTVAEIAKINPPSNKSFKPTKKPLRGFSAA